MADFTGAGGIGATDMTKSLDIKSSALKTSVDSLAASSDMNPGQMLQLQYEMNLFAQFLETSTNFVGVLHDGQKNMIRNLK